MGSAVSAVTNTISSPLGVYGTIGSATGIIPSTGIGDISGIAGQQIGDTLGGLAQGIVSAIPDVPVADQTQVQNRINAAQNISDNAVGNSAFQQQQANALQNQTQQAYNNASGAISNAQYQNQGQGSNVNNAIGLVGQTAAGGGPAQQAARAQLQEGTDQAIRTQQALANSGNLSQQISGQKTAMDNAAQLTQQNANQAAMLQAQMAANAQQAYTGAAGQQASQAAANAGLQQNQTAQQAGLYNTAQNAANNYLGQANTAQGNALNGQTTALGIQQQALGQTGQNKAMAVGGVLSATGAAAPLALASDKDLKKDIKDGKKPISDFLEAIDPVSFKYKEPTGDMGKTSGEHLGIIAQQIEKAPGGESMVIETPKGKAIDLASAVGTLMAAASETHNRVKELEDLFKSKMNKKDKK